MLKRQTEEFSSDLSEKLDVGYWGSELWFMEVLMNIWKKEVNEFAKNEVTRVIVPIFFFLKGLLESKI